jgi:hypothetical protein
MNKRTLNAVLIVGRYGTCIFMLLAMRHLFGKMMNPLPEAVTKYTLIFVVAAVVLMVVELAILAWRRSGR